ncbi:MAG: YfhO family protein [Acidobacteria bacterium]|nr:YfhO family protein [Acidobacteriota bacterium]
MRLGRSERFWVAAGAFATVYLYFVEYLWPLRRVHLFSDIEGFHWPLLSYAFLSLKHGRLPEWDPGIYCGLSFVGNSQAALFYPPNWLLFALNWTRQGISYVSLEFVVALHFWASLLLVYAWFRERGCRLLTSLVAGAAYAFSGYVMGDIQHLGATNAYAWFPLALWGVDQASRCADWRPLWKLVAGSALAYLAGYPPQWVVIAVCAVVYAITLPRRRWLAPAVLAALCVSLALAAVQLLPALEAASLKIPAKHYGTGAPEWKFFLSLFLPNRYDHARGQPAGDMMEQYLYIGAPGLFALVWLIRRGAVRAALPGFALAAACIWVMMNPWRWTEILIDQLPHLNEIVRWWNFLAGLPLATVLLVGVAIEDFLSRPAKSSPVWTIPVMGAIAAWCTRQFAVWIPGGVEFASGWHSGIEAGITLALFSAGLWCLRRENGPRRRRWLTAAMLLAVWTEYKVYGANRRFSALDADVNAFFRLDARTGGAGMIGVHNAVFQELRRHPTYRIGLVEGPVHTDLRHYLLSTPQGFDPLLPEQYRREVELHAKFFNDREFNIDPMNETLMKQFGIRFVITRAGHPGYQALRTHGRFRLMEPSNTFYQVFEYLDAQPAYRWEAGPVQCTRWAPESREFQVGSRTGGRFVLLEQFHPGWRAYVDGRPASLDRYGEAFQQVTTPPGAHQVRFEFRSRGLRVGAVITLALGALFFLLPGMRQKTNFRLN